MQNCTYSETSSLLTSIPILYDHTYLTFRYDRVVGGDSVKLSHRMFAALVYSVRRARLQEPLLDDALQIRVNLDESRAAMRLLQQSGKRGAAWIVAACEGWIAPSIVGRARLDTRRIGLEEREGPDENSDLSDVG